MLNQFSAEELDGMAENDVITVTCEFCKHTISLMRINTSRATGTRRSPEFGAAFASRHADAGFEPRPCEQRLISRARSITAAGDMRFDKEVKHAL